MVLVFTLGDGDISVCVDAAGDTVLAGLVDGVR